MLAAAISWFERSFGNREIGVESGAGSAVRHAMTLAAIRSAAQIWRESSCDIPLRPWKT